MLVLSADPLVLQGTNHFVEHMLVIHVFIDISIVSVLHVPVLVWYRLQFLQAKFPMSLVSYLCNYIYNIVL